MAVGQCEEPLSPSQVSGRLLSNNRGLIGCYELTLKELTKFYVVYCGKQ